MLGSAPLGIATAQQSAGVIHGAVTNGAGAPLAGVTLRLAGTEERQTTDRNGRFRLEHIAAGAYRLNAVLLGYVPAMQELELRPGETTLVRFSLERLVLSRTPQPPLVGRGTRVDTAPAFAFAIDPVARAAGLMRLRAIPAVASRRELRIWMMPSWSRSYLLRIVRDGRSVSGEVVFWSDQPMFDADIPSEAKRYQDSLPVTLPREHRCGPVTVDTLPEGSFALTNARSILALCRRQFSKRPDWSAVLRTFEAHHVWTLPDESELPQPELIVNDGTVMQVEVWDGQRYRSYVSGNSGPSPEAEDAAAIMSSADSLARNITRAGIR